MSDWESSGVSQKVQGPKPSFTQTILPQAKQFGAAASSGCREAWQSQRREEVSLEANEGLVCSSSARMAESRSMREVEAPCMGVPPERGMVVLGKGEEEREEGWEEGREEVRTLGREDMRVPAAEGGAFGIWCWIVVGFGVRERVLARGLSFRRI